MCERRGFLSERWVLLCERMDYFAKEATLAR